MCVNMGGGAGGSSGYYSIYRDGKQVGSANKLSTAKAFAERLNKK